MTILNTSVSPNNEVTKKITRKQFKVLLIPL